ncbi:MAG TPA: hemolysin III family protein [Jatrophihabitantaceae bacterium]|jgi:hemolysin III
MTVARSTGGVAEADRPLLHDSRRNIAYAKPLLRGWLHLLWFEASLVVGTLVLVRAKGASEVTSIAIYAAAVSGLFGTSALYHRGNWRPRCSQWLQRADHMMIFMLIAGTATPAFVLAAPSPYGVVGVTVLWTLTAAAMLTRLVWMSAPEKLAGAIFLALGWTAGLSIPFVWVNEGVAPAALLIAGGLLYTAGALSYHRRRPDPVPTVFGYHEVFHAYVCVAAACQYVAITFYLT